MIELRKINENDLIFVNSVRNVYSEQYLHDSRQFTLDETIEWFNKSNPDFYIIEFNGEKIGYFRLSNHSIKDKSIYIGADIAPEYKGKGFGKLSYKKFIPFIFKEYDLNTIILEVLATNTVAISLYEKLGFKQQSIKVNEVKKGDEFIDSIVMSISRDEYESI
jgi:RimJ/RimL family protein N-acetyltransferase